MTLTQVLKDILSGAGSLGPEITLSLSIFALIVVSMIKGSKESNRLFAVVSLIGMAATGLAIAIQWPASTTHRFFQGMLTVDRTGGFLQALALFGAMVSVIQTMLYKRSGYHKTGEYHILIQGLTLGAFFACRTDNWVMAVLALELMSICAYALTAFSSNKSGSEASVKYLLFGAASTGVSLYGISLFYGITGSLDFSSLVSPAFEAINPIAFALVSFLALAGALFKLASFPFHPWAGDVYEGAPTPAVNLFSTVPKIAGTAILLRFGQNLFKASSLNPEALDTWQIVFGVVAVLTITGGNLLALVQKNAKRMMAFSSVSQGGLFLGTLLCLSDSSAQSLLFYLAVYVFMNSAAFLVIQIREQDDIKAIFRNYKGVGLQAPAYGIATVLVMASLIGLPLTAGFTGKFRIFTSLWEAYSLGSKNILLIIFITAVVNTVIALFFYMRLPYVMCFRKADSLVPFKITRSEYLTLAILSIPVLILFFTPQLITDLVEALPAFF